MAENTIITTQTVVPNNGTATLQSGVTYTVPGLVCVVKAGTNSTITGDSIVFTGNAVEFTQSEGQDSSNGSVIRTLCYSQVTISNSEFTNNSASSDGGVIAMDHHSTASFINCNFDGNSATDHGGAVYGEDATFIIDDCSFTNNSVRYHRLKPVA